jgi:uncharacterized protein Usg
MIKSVKDCSEIELMMRNYRLTTAEIIYHLPDHPRLLQSYIWQELDIAPDFPVLKKFLDFWEKSLDGKLHSVKVASSEIIKPSEMRLIGKEFYIH